MEMDLKLFWRTVSSCRICLLKHTTWIINCNQAVWNCLTVKTNEENFLIKSN